MKKLILLSILFIVGCEETLEPEDCAGVAGGTAELDNCEVCDGDLTNDCTPDCAGTWGGIAVADCNGVCNGDAAISGCDNACNSTAVDDCAGECGGGATLDNCGVCDGDGSTCIVCADCGDAECCDCDGNFYAIVQIGTQLWMAENLKVTKYRDGSEIQYVKSESSEPDIWENLGSGAYSYYDDDLSNVDVYGRLYNWYAVDDSRDVCPDGWHVPSDEEIMKLEMELGMSEEDANSTGDRGTNEGSKLAGNTDLWVDGNLENNSEFGTSGFNILPAGYRSNYDGVYGSMGNNGYFWSFSESSSSNVWSRRLSDDNSYVNRGDGYKQAGFSIRCLRD